jgi:hypothetical protein
MNEAKEKLLTVTHPARLLTTRVRITVAAIVTALIFVNAIRHLHLAAEKARWFLGPPLFHGWGLVAANIFIYGYICWLAFWFIRGTSGRERFFMMGWFAGILFWPVKMSRPQWAAAVEYISAFGLAVALLAAIALFLATWEEAEPNSQV